MGAKPRDSEVTPEPLLGSPASELGVRRRADRCFPSGQRALPALGAGAPRPPQTASGPSPCCSHRPPPCGPTPGPRPWANTALLYLSLFKKQKYIFIVCGFSSIPRARHVTTETGSGAGRGFLQGPRSSVFAERRLPCPAAQAPPQGGRLCPSHFQPRQGRSESLGAGRRPWAGAARSVSLGGGHLLLPRSQHLVERVPADGRPGTQKGAERLRVGRRGRLCPDACPLQGPSRPSQWHAPSRPTAEADTRTR